MSHPALSSHLEILALANVDKFSGDFEIIKSNYVSGNDRIKIPLHVLVPKFLSDGQRKQPRPVMVRIHGGYLVTGSSLYASWWSNWILEYAKNAGAIIVSPDYRLMPEVNGTDILEDMDSFWRWLRTGGISALLPSTTHGSSFKVDLEQTLVLGDSAGGYLAMQLGLSYPDDISALVTIYPVLDVHTKFFTTAYEKPFHGIPNRPISILENHLNSLRSTPADQRQPVTAADPPDRLELSFAIVQHGRYLEFLGEENQKLFPLRRIMDDTDADAAGKGENLPPMFVAHGTDDSVVPYQGTTGFIETLAKTRPLTKYRFTLQPGDHGFDGNTSPETTPWLKSGLDFITSFWLKSSRERSSL